MNFPSFLSGSLVLAFGVKEPVFRKKYLAFCIIRLNGEVLQCSSQFLLMFKAVEVCALCKVPEIIILLEYS